MEFKTIKELEAGADVKGLSNHDIGYLKAKEEVIELIEKNQKINDQLYKEGFITIDQYNSYNGALEELKSRIIGE